LDSTVLGPVAIERVVHPQKASAVIKLLALEGLDCETRDHREGKENKVQQIRQSPNKTGLETFSVEPLRRCPLPGLALGKNLGGRAASQNK
jgi:hypothetical protein